MHHLHSTTSKESLRERMLIFRTEESGRDPETKNSPTNEAPENADLEQKVVQRKDNILKRIDALIEAIPKDEEEMLKELKEYRAEFIEMTQKINNDHRKLDAFLNTYDAKLPELDEDTERNKQIQMAHEILEIAKEVEAALRGIPPQKFKEGAQERWAGFVKKMVMYSMDINNERITDSAKIQAYLEKCKADRETIRNFYRKQGQRNDPPQTRAESHGDSSDTTQQVWKDTAPKSQNDQKDSEGSNEKKLPKQKEGLKEKGEVVSENLAIAREMTSVLKEIENIVKSLPAHRLTAQDRGMWNDFIRTMNAKAEAITQGQVSDLAIMKKDLARCHTNFERISAHRAPPMIPMRERWIEPRVPLVPGQPTPRSIPESSEQKQNREPTMPDKSERVPESRDTQQRMLELRDELFTIEETMQDLLDSLPDSSITKEDRKSWQDIIDDMFVHLRNMTEKREEYSVRYLENYLVNPRKYLQKIQAYSEKKSPNKERDLSRFETEPNRYNVDPRRSIDLTYEVGKKTEALDLCKKLGLTVTDSTDELHSIDANFKGKITQNTLNQLATSDCLRSVSPRIIRLEDFPKDPESRSLTPLEERKAIQALRDQGLNIHYDNQGGSFIQLAGTTLERLKDNFDIRFIVFKVSDDIGIVYQCEFSEPYGISKTLKEFSDPKVLADFIQERREKEKPKAISSLDKMRVENVVIPALQQAFPSTEWWISPHFDNKGRPYICLKVAIKESNRSREYGPAYDIMTSGLVKPVEVNAEEWQVGGSSEELIRHVKQHMESEMRRTYFYPGGGESADRLAGHIKTLQPELVKLMQNELQKRFGDVQCEIGEYVGGTRIDARVNGRTVQHYELIQGVDGKYLIIAKKDTSISKVTAEITANTLQELETKLREHLRSELHKFDVFDPRKDLLAYTHEQWELLKSDERLRSAICEKMGLPKNFPGYLKVEKKGTATDISVHFAFHSPIGHPTPFCLGTLRVDHAAKTISDISSETVKENREKFSFDFQSREREALMAKSLDTELKALAAQEYEVNVGLYDFGSSEQPYIKIDACKDKNRKGLFLGIDLTARKEGDGFSMKTIDVHEWGSHKSKIIETAGESPVTAKTLDREIRKALGIKQAIPKEEEEEEAATRKPVTIDQIKQKFNGKTVEITEADQTVTEGPFYKDSHKYFDQVRTALDTDSNFRNVLMHLGAEYKEKGDPHLIAKIIATIEANKNIPSAHIAIPSWRGTYIALDQDFFFQRVCGIECEIETQLIQILQEKGLLPQEVITRKIKGMDFGGTHVAFIVQRNEYDSGHVVDAWATMQGVPGLVCDSYDDWVTKANNCQAQYRSMEKLFLQDLFKHCAFADNIKDFDSGVTGPFKDEPNNQVFVIMFMALEKDMNTIVKPKMIQELKEKIVQFNKTRHQEERLSGIDDVKNFSELKPYYEQYLSDIFPKYDLKGRVLQWYEEMKRVGTGSMKQDAESQ